MRDNNYQHSYHGLPDHDFASRSLSVTEQAGQHCSDNSSASVQYQSAMSMAPSQPSNLAAKTSQHSLDHMGSMHYQTPMTMWHQIPSQSSNLAAMSMMPQNQQQDAAAVSMMLQSQGLRYYPAPMKMFSSPLQQTQNSQFYHASVACSKRFSEEEKQKLEKVFTDETQKPSTSRKRQLAEELGCPVPKVNNWFQNRRAREKQMHRVQAYEASQVADRTAAENDGVEIQDEDDDDDEDAISSEVDSMSNHSQTFKSSSGRFTETDDSSGHEDPSPRPYDNGRDSDHFVTDSPASISPVKTDRSTEEMDQFKHSIKEEYPSPQLQLSNIDPPFNSSTFDNHHGLLSSSPDMYANTQNGNFETLHDHFAPNYTSLGEMSGLAGLDGSTDQIGYFPPSASFMTQRTPTISTDLMDSDEMEDHSVRRPSDMSNFSGLESLSPDMMPQTSPSMNHTDLDGNETSPNSSIASRRKTRPPQRLNQMALRSFPNGPKTGVEGVKRSDVYGTMRRAASATGPLSGKIFKSGPPVSPLSPRSFDPSFLEQLARTSSLSAASSMKDASSTSPVRCALEQRYLSAHNSGPGIRHRSSCLSLNSFAERMALSPSIAEHSRETSFAGAHHSSFQQHFQHPKFTLDTGYGNVSPDETLTTPGLSQFGSELEFPTTTLSAPRYVESEPATPSYVTIAATTSAAQSQGFPTLKVETPPRNDMWSRSPDQLSVWNGALGHFEEPQSQSFQFQPNITPQNFNSPTGA